MALPTSNRKRVRTAQIRAILRKCSQAGMQQSSASVRILGRYPMSSCAPVTVDCPIEFARSSEEQSHSGVLVFKREQRRRGKGEAEKALLAAGYPRLFVFRSTYIRPVRPGSSSRSRRLMDKYRRHMRAK